MTEALAFPEDHPALSPELPFEDAALEVEYQREHQRFLAPKRGGLSILLLLSLAGFTLVKLGADRSLSSFALLVIALALHELGQFAGLRLVGYRDGKMSFIPIPSAWVSGKLLPWKEGVVLLLGPVPGLLLGLLLLIASLHAPSAPLHTFAMSLLIINGLNLMPFAPLDAGRLFRLSLFSRNRFLEPGFLAVGVAALAFFALQTRNWLLLAPAGFLLITLVFRYRVLRAAPSVRDLPRDPGQLAPAQARKLFTLARAALPWRRVATAMEQILDAAQPPPRFGTTAALLSGWAVALLALCVGIGLLGLAAPAKWSEHQSKDGHFAILLPRAPRVIAVAGTTLEQANQGPERFYQVRWTNGDLRAARPGEVVSDVAVPAAGPTARELRLRRPGGGVAVVRTMKDGERSFEIMVIAPHEEPETQRFLDSFRLLR